MYNCNDHQTQNTETDTRVERMTGTTTRTRTKQSMDHYHHHHHCYMYMYMYHHIIYTSKYQYPKDDDFYDEEKEEGFVFQVQGNKSKYGPPPP
mmetsp:Transcript_34601/g.35192  ORF Transcript_34601/g.35192 Transcript_34601/m.35192 type:complete len:93 (-) Transcript_34601:199-477(-)